MTALVDREVEGNFSGVERYWTGLSAADPNDSSRQDFGDFGQALVSGHLIGWIHRAPRDKLTAEHHGSGILNSKIKCLEKKIENKGNLANTIYATQTLCPPS